MVMCFHLLPEPAVHCIVHCEPARKTSLLLGAVGSAGWLPLLLPLLLLLWRATMAWCTSRGDTAEAAPAPTSSTASEERAKRMLVRALQEAQ